MRPAFYSSLVRGQLVNGRPERIETTAPSDCVINSPGHHPSGISAPFSCGWDVRPHACAYSSLDLLPTSAQAFHRCLGLAESIQKRFPQVAQSRRMKNKELGTELLKKGKDSKMGCSVTQQATSPGLKYSFSSLFSSLTFLCPAQLSRQHFNDSSLNSSERLAKENGWKRKKEERLATGCRKPWKEISICLLT